MAMSASTVASWRPRRRNATCNIAALNASSSSTSTRSSDGRIVAHSCIFCIARGRVLNPNTTSVTTGRITQKMPPAVIRAIIRFLTICP